MLHSKQIKIGKQPTFYAELASELIILDTYCQKIRAFVKLESMRCSELTLESTACRYIVDSYYSKWVK